MLFRSVSQSRYAQDLVSTVQDNLGDFGSAIIRAEDAPEQPGKPELYSAIPRPFTFNDIIHRWQPMGIRIIVNLPYISNDSQWLFLIRHNPYIPWIGEDRGNDICNFSNLFPVRFQPGQEKAGNLDNSAVTITQHSPPPLLSLLSQIHREWRGSIKYRLRTVSNFTAQGYIFATLLRNETPISGIVDPLHTQFIQTQDDYSYSQGMYNSYTQSDLSMFRHLELVVPYEYPVPFFDQFNYFSRGSAAKVGVDMIEHHGDTYIAIGVRGAISTPSTSSQVMFELEYAAGDDFQFGNPFILPRGAFNSKSMYFGKTSPRAQISTTLIMPDKRFKTDGINTVTAA